MQACSQLQEYMRKKMIKITEKNNNNNMHLENEFSFHADFYRNTKSQLKSFVYTCFYGKQVR